MIVRYWRSLAALALLGRWAYLRYRNNILFSLRLMNAKRVADQFYRRYEHITRDVDFMPGSGARLDVYRPASGSGHPVLIYFYGGSWYSGNKALYAPMAQRLIPENMVVVIPDYSLYPRAGYPRQSQEAAAAIAWTLANIARFGGDPSRVVVAAQSAGAQVAALALLDPRWLAAHGRRASEVCGFIGLSGVYDVSAQVAFERAKGRAAQFVISVMGGPDNLAPASPITFAPEASHPIFLIHGDADGTVPVEISTAFHQRLIAAGAASELVIYPGAGHSGILFDALVQNRARLTIDLLDFIRRCTQARPMAQLAAP